MAKGSVYEGKSFEEAVRRGLDDLGLSRAEATITLVEEGKGGFLGFGARPFRVSIMRRPGGAVREPEETRERRVSSRRDDRRGGRGGRERERGKDREKDRDKDREAPAGPRRRDEGRRGPQPVRAEGAAEERGGEARREPRGEGRREPRGEGRREERGEARREPRGEARREERPEGRREERGEGRREERRPAAAAGPAPVSAEGAGESASEMQERRRRRRGRRGGRGRRREGAPGAASETEGSTNGTMPEAEAYEVNESFAPQREFETGEAPFEPATERVPAYSEPAPRAESVARAEAPVALEHHEEPAMAAGELAEQSRRLTEELLRAMGFEATVTVVAEGNRADVTAEIAKDDDLLNGQKGEVRQALQHLLNRFVNRGEGSRYHLQLEINDFWHRRERELEDLARSLAERAVTESTEVVTDYLNSQERRIVHVTLKEDARVKTYALGTGMIKRVAVAPAGFPERTEEEDAG